MSWTDFIYALGDFFLWTFGILRVLGNNFNWLLITIGFVMAIWWITNLVKFSREAKQNGTIE
ncbi:MAG: hypothetical protein CL840_07955 [Crocinitomicaceae bacterium]|nr:hypothetical protein [Crocinitomicaceae bacterium]|tara:strand:- start:9200 stop:9385 length:186 start_codon:yes stop_codon:yes gene_type:complete